MELRERVNSIYKVLTLSGKKTSTLRTDFGHIGEAGWAVLGQLASYAAANTADGRRDFRLGMTETQVRDYYLSRWEQRISHAARAETDRSMQRRLALSRRHLTV